MLVNRRMASALFLAGFGTMTGPLSHANAQNAALYDLLDDAGQPVANYRLSSELSTEGLPGIIWTGSETPNVILVEFFDYNCPFCRKAANELDALAAKNPGLRIGLVNNAILGIGSIQVAKVQQGVLKLYGPKRAHDFHAAIFAHRGTNDAAAALLAVKALNLDVAAVAAATDGADVTVVLKRQAALASDLGFAATPSFMINGVGILGYPGPRTMAKMVAAVAKCEKPVC